MRPDHDGDESEPFTEADETGNLFEHVAQTIVMQVRAMIQHRARYGPVDASDFPERDASYYDGIERELSTLGFTALGDFEDAGAAPAARGQSFVRLALGAHGAIAASWFEAPRPDGESERCLVLHSWLDDGRAIITSRQTSDSGLPIHPDVVMERLDPALNTISAVRAHGERVADAARAPRRLAGLGDVFAAYSSDERKTAEFREAQGAALFEPLLRAMLGASFEEQGEPILDAIYRHPEWLRSDTSSGDGGDAARFPHLVIAHIPEHIEPIERAERYEDPLQDALAISGLGVITGGGSQLTPTGDIAFVEVELALANLDGALEVVKRILEEAEAPAGSQLLFRRNGRDVALPISGHD
jgi:hypothetical protein